MLARLGRRTTIAVALTIGLAAYGCSSDDGGTNPGGGGGGGSAVVGTWNATSFVALGTDFIAQGMGITFTFDADGTYTFNVTNDTGGVFCFPGPSCTDNGSYTATATTITLDPGTTDEAVLNYSVSSGGSVITVNTTIEGVPITATFVKA